MLPRLHDLRNRCTIHRLLLKYRSPIRDVTSKCPQLYMPPPHLLSQCFSTFWASCPSKRQISNLLFRSIFFCFSIVPEIYFYVYICTQKDADFAWILLQLLFLFTQPNKRSLVIGEIWKFWIFKNISSPRTGTRPVGWETLFYTWWFP